MAADYFGYFGIIKLINWMPINSQRRSLIFSIGTIIYLMEEEIKKVRKDISKTQRRRYEYKEME